MKVNKTEKYMLLLAAVVLIFCVGYLTGFSRGQHRVTVSSSVSSVSNTAVVASGTSDDDGDTSDGASEISSDKLNINEATADELASLPGIGDVLAERIIEYRASNGAFSSTEEIMNVYGIGESKFDAIKDYITV